MAIYGSIYIKGTFNKSYNCKYYGHLKEKEVGLGGAGKATSQRR